MNTDTDDIYTGRTLERTVDNNGQVMWVPSSVSVADMVLEGSPHDTQNIATRHAHGYAFECRRCGDPVHFQNELCFNCESDPR